MAYIGRGTDKISNIEKLDTITFDGSSSYTLQKNSVNFTPNSANSLQVSIDGVVQAGNFTVSGSTIDFGVAIPATSTNDFIFHYGTGLITTPADGTVGLAQLSATGTKDSTTFLRGDNTFAEAGGGKLLQIVTANNTTLRETTSTTYVSGTLSASITPSSTSSKVYIIMNLHTTTAFGNLYAYYTIYRNNTTDLASGSSGFQTNVDGEASWDVAMGQNINHLDSPNTTSATTYTLYFKADSGGKAKINNSNLGESTITLMEIAG